MKTPLKGYWAAISDGVCFVFEAQKDAIEWQTVQSSINKAAELIAFAIPLGADPNDYIDNYLKIPEGVPLLIVHKDPDIN